MRSRFHARKLILMDGEVIDHPVLTVVDGVLAAVENGEPNGSDEVLTGCFVDVHFHGAMGHDVMAASVSELHEVGQFLARHGVGHYLPTTVTSPLEETLHALERLGKAVARGTVEDAATPVGIHLEGPFLSHAKRGVHPPASILEPSVALFDRFQQAADGAIRLVTLAPELPGALELIEHVTARGVRVSMGHSDATARETEAAIAAGATSATHTFNAMRTLDHREPGILGTVLDREDVYAEAIADGVHVAPAMLRLWLRMKGDRKAILMTDGMSATGMPDGNYRLGDMAVEVRGGVCLADGRLAGSVLTMDRAVANLQAFTGASLATAVRLASANPAAMLGWPELGKPRVGQAANFNVFDLTGHQRGTILHGQRLQTGAAAARA